MEGLQRVLVANRGEIARRIVRAASAMGLETVAVFSDPDRDAPVVGEADQAVRLPGASPRDTYLAVEALVDAAARSGADTVHPGYGFLSEHAAFARACRDAGLVFVGPDPAVIEAMGSKLGAKRVMAEAGVPVLASEVVRDPVDHEALATAGARIGYPLLVKAAAGGGGRGMRVVGGPDELADAVGGAAREAASAFGDGTVFLERFVDAPRHVEVQIVGDRHGTVVQLGERECSIQRRFQKVVEEAPSPAVGPELRAALGAAAVSAGTAIGYTNAGTVEFVVDADGRFYFLEVNARLQVEHPVTELVTGLDLVQLQFRVAAGEPLPAEARAVTVHGHAIEARLYAEDVPAGFVPTSGRLDRFVIPAGDGIRVDAGYAGGSTVGTEYDAMLAKVIAWAPTRGEAIRRLRRVLRDAELDGPPTNRDLLVRTLASDDFAAGQTDTGFVARHGGPALGRSPLDESDRRLHAVAAALALRDGERAGSPLPEGVEPGWRNVGRAEQPFDLTDEIGTVRVVLAPTRGGLAARVDDDELPVAGWSLDGDRVAVEIGGVRRAARVHSVRDTVYVQDHRGASRWQVVPRFTPPSTAAEAGSLRAPLPGRVVAVLVETGDEVQAGQPLLSLEAMKMEHTIQAPAAGRVSEVRVGADDQVELGQVLLVVVADPGPAGDG